MERITMKKIVLFFIGVSIILLALSCTKTGTNNNDLSDYRPMVYVQDNLYAETADVTSILPDQAIYIGKVERVIPQNEPMQRENFTSNALPVGSEIYYSESEPTIIYVSLLDTNEEKYSMYTIIK